MRLTKINILIIQKKRRDGDFWLKNLNNSEYISNIHISCCCFCRCRASFLIHLELPRWRSEWAIDIKTKLSAPKATETGYFRLMHISWVEVFRRKILTRNIYSTWQNVQSLTHPANKWSGEDSKYIYECKHVLVHLVVIIILLTFEYTRTVSLSRRILNGNNMHLDILIKYLLFIIGIYIVDQNLPHLELRVCVC